MTVLAGETPARADGLQLIGEMRGSGYRTPPALVRRADGQTLQLTPLLYALLEEIDGRRDCLRVADALATRLGKSVTAENVAHLIEDQLRPMGMLALADGSQPQLKRSNPLLGLRMRFAVTDPTWTRRLTAPFAALLNPLIAIPVSLAFLAVAGWLLFVKGLGSATYAAFQNPGLLLLILLITVLSAGFHEFGHAAAARYGGATPGTMGAGLYLVWPAFYTDVTDSYRLGRGGRLRTDLGGLYFNSLVALGVMGIWLATSWDGWLLVVVTQVLQMVRQLAPMVRFDGYHILADLTGVPDLFHRIKPTLLGFLPKYRRSPEVNALKPWTRVVVTLWVLAVVPLLAFALVMMIIALPRMAGTAMSAAQVHAAYFSAALDKGDLMEMGARAVAMAAVTLPVVAALILLSRLGKAALRKIMAGSTGRPVKRFLAVVLAAMMVGSVAYAWWPTPGKYRPVQPWERGSITDVVQPIAARVAPDLTRSLIPQSMTAPAGMAYRSAPAFRKGFQGTTTMQFAKGEAVPTRAEPRMAMVLVPRADPNRPDVDDQTWVFPFNRPLGPGEGDNQAMAVNTKDGGTTYDVAFAMYWATDNEQVDNINSAYALASCKDCTTVAVAFNVVFVVGQADVIIPQNLSAAVNYNCQSCVTVALAQQLIVTLNGPLSEEAMAEISKIWSKIGDLEKNITNMTLTEITTALDQLEVEMLTVLQKYNAIDGLMAPSASSDPTTGATASPSGTATASATDTPSSTPTDSTTTSASSPSPTSTFDPTSAATPGSGTGTSSTQPQPSQSPTPGSSPTATTTAGAATATP